MYLAAFESVLLNHLQEVPSAHSPAHIVGRFSICANNGSESPLSGASGSTSEAVSGPAPFKLRMPGT
eukprot:9707484-Alexandrium_andersonii.AAC.1